MLKRTERQLIERLDNIEEQLEEIHADFNIMAALAKAEQVNTRLSALLIRLTTNYDTEADDNEHGAETLARSVTGGGRIEFDRIQRERLKDAESKSSDQ